VLSIAERREQLGDRVVRPRVEPAEERAPGAREREVAAPRVARGGGTREDAPLLEPLLQRLR
jgi:hypothetical protein